MTMGIIFFQNSLLQWFFQITCSMERLFFGKNVILSMPADPLHQLLIHGFGAGVIILGATLIYSYSDPKRFLPFIFFDGLGRLIYGMTMIYFVLTYGLVRMVLVFGLVELGFASAYLYTSWYLTRHEYSSSA